MSVMAWGARRRGMLAVAAVVTAVLGVGVLSPVPAFAADDPALAPVRVELRQDVSPQIPDTAGPGELVTYTMGVACSSLETDCIDLTVTDTIPEPLVLQSVTVVASGDPDAPTATATMVGNGFTVTLTSDLGGGMVGLTAGASLEFTVVARVPSDVSADWDGQTVVNTATATVRNHDSGDVESVSTLLEVPTQLSSTIGLQLSPDSVPGIAGTVLTATVTASNTSNRAVDALTLQVPASSTDLFDYTAITGLSVTTWPAGADAVQVDWLAGASSTWNLGTPQPTASLPSGVNASTLKGLRLTFTSSTGGIARSAQAVVSVATALRSAVTAIDPSAVSTAAASSWVSYAGVASTPVSASDSVTINRVTIAPIATRAYDPDNLVGGRTTRVTLAATNGGNFTYRSMSIQEAATGTPSLAEQGLTFVAWDNARIEWPVGATGASVRYLYADSGGLYGSALSTGVRNTLPAPQVGRQVTGFIVEFTGTTMTPGQYASIAYTASTEAVVADVTTTGTASVNVITTTDATASATASDDLTRRTARVNTSVSKVLQPSAIYSVPGASTVISLPARVEPMPTGPADPANPTGSTVGATRLIVADTADPATDPFWDSFDVAAVIATDVPDDATLTVEYWNGADWVPIDAAATAIAGPTTWGRVFSADERAAFGGIRFVFEAVDGAELAPGLNVQPNIKAVLRDTLRSDSGTVASDREADSMIDNAVRSRVENAATTPAAAEFEFTAPLSLIGVPGSGGGGGGGGSIAMITKTWDASASTGEKSVLARSSDRITARISWGTGGLGYESVTITDSAARERDGAPAPAAETIFEAFDLVRIPAISASTDPLLRYDRISAVELYYDDAWQPTSACDGDACDGTFPGYTLTSQERAAATAVRLVFVESPTRSARIGTDPLAPLVGSGVAASMSQSRQFALEFEVRDTRRSNGEAVLGATRAAMYNAADAGVVVNAASIVGVEAGGVQRRDDSSDTLSILDRPINVVATKSWTDGPLGIPPVNTPQSLYPTARLVVGAQNTSAIRINQLGLIEPSGGMNPFEYVNLSRIVSITVPSGATTSRVILQPSGDEFTIAQATALTPAELADVTGIEVVHEGRIAPSARTTVTLNTQLRATERTSGDAVAAQVIDNIVQARVVDPAGLTAPAAGTDNEVTSTASATMAIAAFEYGAVASKSLIGATTSTATAPAIQYDGSSTQATVVLGGRPTGNVRTTRMVIEDSTPTFWNAYRFADFAGSSFAAPIDRVQVDILVGVSYELDGAELVARCAGSADLEPCWKNGVPSTSLTLPTVSGVTKDDIRGLRFTYTRADYAAWERPFNPEQFVTFTVDRRSTLVWAPQADTPVPSTLYIYPNPAPGETALATFSNEVLVEVAAAEDAADTSPLWAAEASQTRALTLRHLSANVEVRKGPFGGQSLGPAIPFAITVKNTGAAGDKALTGLVITDRIQGDAQGPMLVIPDDPDTGMPLTADEAFSYTLRNGAGVLQPAPAVVADIGTGSPAGQDLTFTVPGSLPVGWTLTITTPLQFRPQLVAATPVNNAVTVVSDQEFDRCDRFDDASTTPTSQQTFVPTCGTQTTVSPLPSAPMTIIKGVRGVGAGPLDDAGVPLGFDDLGVLKTVPTNPVACDQGANLTINGTGYYRFPCVPITRPGGEEEWIARFANSGNVPVAEVVAIDLLPTANDTGVILNESRGSKWKPKLSQYPVLVGAPDGSTLTVYYTKSTGVATPRCNAADIQFEMGMDANSNPRMSDENLVCLSGAEPDAVKNRDWAVLDPSADAAFMADIVALKFVVSMPAGLSPGSAISISYRSITAAVPQIIETDANLGRDSVAFNSIAGAAVGIGTDENDQPIDLAYRFVTEPRKVGVALATGQLRLLKSVTGTASSFAPSSFALSLACVSDGEPITLRSSTGAARSPFTVTPGAELVVRGIPLYAQCTVTEDTNYGQTTKTITPETVRAEAAIDAQSGSNVSNPRPAFGAANRPAIELSTVTNSYASASLVVTKTVDNGGAVNQAGTPIAYTASNFRAVCRFDRGAGPYVVSDTTFTLANGASRTIGGLVAGAVCVVTETNTRGAQTTTTVVTQGGTSGSATTGTARTVTLQPDVNTVAYTNTYGVSSITVRKTVVGDAANTWGNTSFTVNVTCTNSNASPTTVWNETITLTKTGTTQIPDRLISSSIAGGANCTVTEPDDGGATSRSLPAAATTAAGASRTFTVTNTFSNASLTVNKVVQTPALDQDDQPVFVADSFTATVQCEWDGRTVLPLQTITLSRTGSQSFPDLPAGASCTVTETDTGGADSTSIGAVDGTTATVVLAGGPNTATITNRYAVSSFTVTKDSLGGAAAQFGQGPFTIAVACTAPGGAIAFDGDVTLADGQSETIENLPDGSTCTATEADSLGADATSTVFDPGDLVTGNVVTVTKTNPGRATIQNWYLTGALTVTKTIEGDAGDYAGGPYPVTIQCTRDGQSVAVTDPERDLIPGAMSTTFTGLPSGATCVVRETDSAGATSSFIGSAPDSPLTSDVAAGYPFIIAVDGASRADNQAQPVVYVVNRYDPASLVIEKQVTGAAGIEYGPFPVSVLCEFEGETIYQSADDLELVANTPLTIGDLVAGAACTITETDQMDASATVIRTEIAGTGLARPGTSATVVLAADADGAAANLIEIENTYGTGSITLAKTMPGDGNAWAPESFEVRLVCVLDDASGERTVLDETVSLAAGDNPVQFDDVAAGADCTVTEPDSGEANATRIIVDTTVTDDSTAQFVSADSVTVTVENTFTLATVAVTKQRTGGADLWGDGPFEVTLECSRASGPIEIPGGATRTLQSPTFAADYAGLPLGARCDIQESRSGGATSVEVPGAFTLAEVSTPIVIENDFAEGAIAVEKQIEGEGALLWGEGPFIVTLACTRLVDGTATVVDIPGGATRELNLDGSYAARFERLPAGADCELTETGTGGATVAAEPVQVEIVADSDTQVTLVNEFALGMLVVTNRVTGTDWERNQYATFVVELTCTLEVNGEARQIQIPGGAQRDITHLGQIEYLDLPVGAQCELLETVTNNAELVSIEAGDPSSVVSKRTWRDKGTLMELTTLSIGREPVRFDVVNVFNIALARTGATAAPVGFAGALLALVGVGMFVADRRRRRRRGA